MRNLIGGRTWEEKGETEGMEKVREKVPTLDVTFYSEWSSTEDAKSFLV